MRILIADDDAISRVMLDAIAKKLGHDCLTASDGSSAWQMLSTHGIDVLLTDWMMPGLDGPQLCKRVREELTDHYIYIVLITGQQRPEQVMEGMNAGADDYLIKPIYPFGVQTRLIAAERVTTLHRQVAEFRTQLEQANRELLGHSLTDPLTGLGNRRRMEQDLATTHARAVRDGQPYAIALFDIDHFKLFNDHHGHPAGDEALRQVAHQLTTATRAGETIYRYGGEEFLLLLPGCDPAAATEAATRIREAVTHGAITHHARPTHPAVITLSGGLSCWTPGSTQPPAQVVHQADQALYQAKSAGRNRLRLSDRYTQPYAAPTDDKGSRTRPAPALIGHTPTSQLSNRTPARETHDV